MCVLDTYELICQYSFVHLQKNKNFIVTVLNEHVPCALHCGHECSNKTSLRILRSGISDRLHFVKCTTAEKKVLN